MRWFCSKMSCFDTPFTSFHFMSESSSLLPHVALAKALQGRDIEALTRLLREHGAAALGRFGSSLSPLEDVLPAALALLAESYDRNGIVGDEERFFLLAKECWQLMSPMEREIPEMVCTFVSAAIKFSQKDFLRFMLPIAVSNPSVSLPSLCSDRAYPLNQLRHTVGYYIAKTGSLDSYNVMREAMGGQCPYALEAENFCSAAMESVGVESRKGWREDTMYNSPKWGDVDPPDPPSLFVALSGKRYPFIAHVLKLSPPPLQARLLRLVVVHGCIAADDAESAGALLGVCKEVGVGMEVVQFAFGAGRSVSVRGVSGGGGGVEASELPDPAPTLPSLNSPTPPPCAYYALHLAVFVSETSSEASFLRAHAAVRYVSWLLRTLVGGEYGKWPALFSPFPTMLWAHLCGGGGGVGEGGGGEGGGDSPSLIATRATHWKHWSPIHSCAAAGNADILERVVWALGGSTDLIFSSAIREGEEGGGGVHPVRVAAESTFWTRRWAALRLLTSWLTPTLLEDQLFAPLRSLHLHAIRPSFVKLLCKEGGLQLRAFKVPPSPQLSPLASQTHVFLEGGGRGLPAALVIGGIGGGSSGGGGGGGDAKSRRRPRGGEDGLGVVGFSVFEGPRVERETRSASPRASPPRPTSQRSPSLSSRVTSSSSSVGGIGGGGGGGGISPSPPRPSPSPSTEGGGGGDALVEQACVALSAVCRVTRTTLLCSGGSGASDRAKEECIHELTALLQLLRGNNIIQQ